jgi:hypothetical protein
MKILLLSLIATAASAQQPAKQTEPAALTEKVLSAVGGRDKILRAFTMEETFHGGEASEPAEGKKLSTRKSELILPDTWLVSGKERGEEPAKDDVRAWSLELLLDPKSKIEALPNFKDEGVECVGLKVSESVTPSMELYFDASTHLLRRLNWRGDFYRFDEWKELDGLKYASHTVIFKTKRGKAWFHHRITKLERKKP